MKVLYSFLLILVLSTQTQASVLTSLLNFGDSTPDSLSDDSAGVLIKGATNTGPGLEVGDVIQGVINFDQVNGVTVSDSSVWGVYALEVKSLVVGGGVPTGGGFIPRDALVLGAVSDLSLNVDAILASAGVSTAGLTSTGTSGSNLLAVVEHNSTNFTIPTDASAVSGTSILSGGKVGGQVDGTWTTKLLAGFDAIDDTYEISTFFVPGVGGTLPAGFDAAFTVFEHGFDPSVQFLDIENSNLGVDGNIVVSGGTIETPLPEAAGKGFDFEDGGVFFINAVPEPNSLIAFVGLFGIAAARRRR